MKRGLWFLTILIILSFTVNAKEFNFSECYGVNICNQGFTCGTLDSICTDDFFTEDSGLSCTNEFELEGYSQQIMKCLDPDCVTCFTGRVVDSKTRIGIVGAEVDFLMSSWDAVTGEITLTETTTTQYDSREDLSGNYTLYANAGNEIFLKASAFGYAPQVKGPFFNILQTRIEDTGGSGLSRDDRGCYKVNFELQVGTCQGDCTRRGSDYCDETCQGEGAEDLCSFNTSTTYGSTTITPPIEACTKAWGFQKGTNVQIGKDEITGMCIYVNCCEGTPFEQPCPEASVSSRLISGTAIKNLIKVSRIAKIKGRPVKVVLYYWE